MLNSISGFEESDKKIGSYNPSKTNILFLKAKYESSLKSKDAS